MYDVIRSERLEAALACFDAALRSIAWDAAEHSYDLARAAEFRNSVTRRIRANPGSRGIRQARLVAELADGRAQLPGESISRLWMLQLGLPAPELQFEVDLSDGTYAYLDFAWPEFGVWGEFDGQVKYSDPAMLNGRTADEVREAQRERSRAIARVTGWTEVRWGFEQMPDHSAFADHLRENGLLLLRARGRR